MSALSEYINAKMTEQLAQRSILGVILCVRDNEENVLHLNAHRSSTAPLEAVLDKNGLFLLASQSKTFTAVATLLLVQRGVLDIDQGLARLLPHSVLANMTVRDLLQHRAPLNWSDTLYKYWDNGGVYPTVEEITSPDFASMLDAERRDHGGEAPQYSNTCYALLGAVIERITGAPYADFVQKNLLQPKGLDEIHPGLSAEKIAGANNIIQGYRKLKDRTFKRTPVPSMGACIPAGGFYATAEQVSKFYHLLLKGEILNPHSLQMMQALSNEIRGTVPEGVGLHHYRDGSLGHGGVMTGYESRTVHRDGVTISIMSNLCALPDKSETLQQQRKESAIRDRKEFLFPAIINLVREALARHPDCKANAERPGCNGSYSSPAATALVL